MSTQGRKKMRPTRRRSKSRQVQHRAQEPLSYKVPISNSNELIEGTKIA